MQLFADEDESEQAYCGENVKLKLRNVEEEVYCTLGIIVVSTI